MHFLLITIGSHGDVHPFVGLGLRLLERGHRATLVTNAHFNSLADRAGLEFEPLGDEAPFLDAMKNPDLWHPTGGFKAVMRFGVSPLIKTTYERVAERHAAEGDRLVVVGSTLAFGARIAEEKLGVNYATMHLSPVCFRSCHDTPKYPGLFMPRWMPLGIKRRIWEGGDRFVIDPVVAPPVNALRAELGMAPVARVMDTWWNSTRLVLAMFPDWLSPRQPDWPAEAVHCGFPLYDERGHEPLSGDLLAFLDSGSPPIAFTPGSAMLHGKPFFEAAAGACERLGRRGLLLTRHAINLPARLPEGVIHVPFAPFSQLLPRCAALVHHGGIGSLSQALSAGVPQVIMPMAHDQLDNAARVRRLGVGDSLARSRFTAPRLARVLAPLLENPEFTRRSRELAVKMGQMDGLGAAVDHLEQTFVPAALRVSSRDVAMMQAD